MKEYKTLKNSKKESKLKNKRLSSNPSLNSLADT